MRIALTFVPVILIKNMKAKRHLQWAEARGDHEMAERVRAMRTKTVFFHVLLFIPAALFWATILASLERTPLTGRYAPPLGFSSVLRRRYVQRILTHEIKSVAGGG